MQVHTRKAIVCLIEVTMLLSLKKNTTKIALPGGLSG